jgi:hypothetical protein
MIPGGGAEDPRVVVVCGACSGKGPAPSRQKAARDLAAMLNLPETKVRTTSPPGPPVGGSLMVAVARTAAPLGGVRAG